MNVIEPPIHVTKPELFILESLNEADEQNGRYEGRLLYKALKMAGRNPIYYYFRTKEELELLAYVYRESGYRYLHFSCHGGSVSIDTTLAKISYSEFAQIFGGLLRNRRLFMSACEAGNELFSECVAATNKGMYSIAAPANKIGYREAYAIWVAFYTKLYLNDNDDKDCIKPKIKAQHIDDTLKKVCRLFDERFHLSVYNANKDQWNHKIIS